jgi:hypothetical protein
MAQPQYIGEVAPTHLRGRLTGFYGTCFQVGSVCVSTTYPQGIIRSTNQMADVSRYDWLRNYVL